MPSSGSIAGPVVALINEFSKLPTIGPKTAARLVFYLLNRPRHEAQTLAEAIVAVKDRVRFCSVCFSLTEADPCSICGDPSRDRDVDVPRHVRHRIVAVRPQRVLVESR